MSTVTTRLGLTKPAGIEQFSVALYNNNLDIVDAYNVANTEKLAKGIAYRGNVTTLSGAVSAIAVINNIASFTFKANRRYRIVWESDFLTTVANSVGAFTIATALTTDGSSLTTGLTNLRVKNAQAAVAGSSAPMDVTAYAFYGADTTVQVKFLAALDAGSGTVQLQGNRAGGSNYNIYDDGAFI